MESIYLGRNMFAYGEWLECGQALVSMLKPGYKKTADKLWGHLDQDLQDMLRLAIGDDDDTCPEENFDSESLHLQSELYRVNRSSLIDLGLVAETSLRGKWGHLVCTKVGYVLWELVSGHVGESATGDGR